MSTISCYNLFFESICCNSSASGNQSFCDFVLETALGHLLYRRCPKGWLFLPGETAAADAGCSHKSVGATAESPAFTQAKAGDRWPPLQGKDLLCDETQFIPLFQVF